MPESKVKREVQDQKCTSNTNEFTHISGDLNSLRNRHSTRRGPFIISDEDLNNQFELNSGD